VPLMPAREPRPEPLARARARLEFDALVRRRVEGIANPSIAAGPVGQGHPPTPAVQRAQLVEAVSRSFADAVDRENSSRGILRTGVQVEYVDAVVLSGQAGQVVVDAPEYDASPVYWQARLGEVDSVVRGRDLDAFLRTGDKRYAEQLGLDS
jgi:hypothetical protein